MPCVLSVATGIFADLLLVAVVPETTGGQMQRQEGRQNRRDDDVEDSQFETGLISAL